jgi:DNA-binding MarR family transcriptional regulator
MGRRPIKPDQLLFEPTRFALTAFLKRSGGKASFTTSLDRLSIRYRGALSAHASILANAGFIRLQKSGAGNRRQTFLILTAEGQQALARHKALVDEMMEVAA